MYQKLFSDFEDSSKQAWLDQVRIERKGKDYKGLLWSVTDKLIIEPYYTGFEFNSLIINELVQSRNSKVGWLNQAFISFESVAITSLQIQEAIAGGADALWLSLGNVNLTAAELKDLLNEVSVTTLPIVFENSAVGYQALNDWITANKSAGGFAFDPLSDWMQGKTLMDECHSQLVSMAESLPYDNGFRPIMIGSHVFHNAGANVVQELAFTISLLVQYLDWLTEKNIPVVRVMDSLFISISVGTHYLTETAKIRALRELHKRVCDAYGVPSKQAFVNARASAFYETTMSSDTNFIRTTVGAMAAVTGGCDSLTVIPHSSENKRGKDFSARIARNVSHVMREEALMGKVADPAAGSYLIDKLTLELVDKAWELFLETEKRGGLVEAFEQGFIQEELDASWRSKIESYKNENVLVGVNKYSDSNEKVHITRSDKQVKHDDIHFLPVRKLEEGINSSKSL